MGNHPSFVLYYGVTAGELVSEYDSDLEEIVFEFDGKPVVYDEGNGTGLPEELSDLCITCPIRFCDDPGEETVVGFRVFGVDGSCELVSDVTIDQEKLMEFEELFSRINTELSPRLIGMVDVS